MVLLMVHVSFIVSLKYCIFSAKVYCQVAKGSIERTLPGV